MPFPYFVIPSLGHSSCFSLLLNLDLAVLFEPDCDHWLLNMCFSKLLFVLCTILFPGNTSPTRLRSLSMFLVRLGIYLHYSICLMNGHCLGLRNRLLVLLFSKCIEWHQKF